MRYFIALLITLTSLQLQAASINSQGYVTIKQIKSFNSYYDIHLESDQPHKCPNTGYLSRFRLKVADSHHITLLLAAFSARHRVNLNYICDDAGHPLITGVRMLP